MTDTLTNGHGTPRERAEAIARAELDAGRRPVASQIAATVGEPARSVSRWIGQLRTAQSPPSTPATAAPAATQRPIQPRQRRPATPTEPPADWLDRWMRPLVTFGLSAIALLMSYSHMRALSADAGVAWPALMPLAVDWLMVAGWLCLRRHRRYPLAVTAVTAGVAASLAMNAIAARPELADLGDVRLACALAIPVCAVLGVHLFLKR